MHELRRNRFMLEGAFVFKIYKDVSKNSGADHSGQCC